jgi:hypothetical protein
LAYPCAPVRFTDPVRLASTVPELDGKRVRAVLDAVDEQRLTTEQQSELWKAWVARGPQGPIDDGPDTELP